MRTKTVAGSALVAVAALIAASYIGIPGLEGLGMWAVASVLVAVFAIGYPRLLGLPVATAHTVVIALAGLAAVALASVTAMPAPMAWLPACGAAGVVLVFLTQLLRGPGAELRLQATAAGACGVLVAVLGAGWVGADRLAPNASNSSMMLLSGASIAAAILACTIPWPDRITAPLALLLAVLVGGVASALVRDVAVLPASVVGAVAGAVVVCFRLMRTSSPPRGGQAPRIPTIAAMAIGAAPVVASGGLVYFVERLLLS